MTAVNTPVETLSGQPLSCLNGQIVPNRGPVALLGTTTSATLTAAQLLAGYLVVTPTNATALTFPTAALLVAALNNPAGAAYVGQRLYFTIVNAAAFVLTATAGVGVTLHATLVAAQAVSTIKTYMIELTNVTAGAEAYTVYAGGAQSTM